MSGQRILVVDDEIHIRRLLRSTLERTGYQVLEATNAREALEQARWHKPELVLLDLGLADRDGLELIPLLKKDGFAIVVVSARDATDQKVAALDLGAADYVTKPFDTEELLARLRAAQRSRFSALGGKPVVAVGDVVIDLEQRRITLAGVEIHLTRKEYDVLTQLALAPGRVVTHKAVLDKVWPHESDGRVEYLRIVVRNLRQKLEQNPAQPRLILNEMGVGYRLVTDD